MKVKNLNEGKIPAGLQAYLDKKKGKKEDKKEVKEEVINGLNIAINHFISEGYSELRKNKHLHIQKWQI